MKMVAASWNVQSVAMLVSRMEFSVARRAKWMKIWRTIAQLMDALGATRGNRVNVKAECFGF
jgi:hypothetical protein